MSSNETLEPHILRAFMKPGQTTANGCHNVRRRTKPAPGIVVVQDQTRFVPGGAALLAEAHHLYVTSRSLRADKPEAEGVAIGLWIVVVPKGDGL